MIDALLGAGGLGDIGTLFPDDEERWRDADSVDMLRTVVGMICGRIVNIDATVVCEAPRLAPVRAEMERILAEATSARVSVKATTNEGMGWVGRGEGIACIAVASVRANSLRVSMASLSSIGSSVRKTVANKAFVVKVMHDSEILGLLRPDVAAKIGYTFVRWGPSPATGVATAALHHPHETAIIDERGSLTFEQLHRRTTPSPTRSRRWGSATATDRVMCRNHRGFIEATAAAAKIGASAIYLNTIFAGPQLAEVTRRERPKVLVYDEEFAELLHGVDEGVER